MANRLRTVIKKILGAGAANRLMTLMRGAPLDVESINQQLQMRLLVDYRRQFLRGERPFDSIGDAGFRCYSQFEEDGILLYILAGIGMKTRSVVEIGCGTGVENMSSNLILNHGFRGYLFDGSASNIEEANSFYRLRKDCLLNQPKLVQVWITRENVNEILRNSEAEGEVDVFSLDIDGNDWYVWHAIEAINPRICVFETHSIVPDGLAVTIPYDPNFDYTALPERQRDFRSASLGAMVTLSLQKGYRLIGAHRYGFNVFFLRQDIAPDLFPEVSIEQVHDNLWTRQGQMNRWPAVSGMNWVKV